MSMMYRIFYAILAAGGIGGVLFAFWARAFAGSSLGFGAFVGLSFAVGIVFGFINYIFVKAVLRIFVNKFFTLERVLVGTDPEPLPNVFLSNEIDEMEASMVRITDEFNRLNTGGARRTSRTSLPAGGAAQGVAGTQRGPTS